MLVGVEVSQTIHPADGQRARLRADILRRAGHGCLAAAAGERITDLARDTARTQGVAVVKGRVEGWEEALAGLRDGYHT